MSHNPSLTGSLPWVDENVELSGLPWVDENVEPHSGIPWVDEDAEPVSIPLQTAEY